MNNPTVCRSCLAPDAAVEMSSHCDGVPLRSLLELVAGVAVDVREGLPRRVCDACRRSLLRFHEFRLRARRTDAELRQRLVRSGPIPELDIDLEVTEPVAEVPSPRQKAQSLARNKMKHRPKKTKKKTLKSQSALEKHGINISTARSANDIAMDKADWPDNQDDPEMDIFLSALSCKTSSPVRPDAASDPVGPSDSSGNSRRALPSVKRPRAAEHVCEVCGYRAADRCSLRVHRRFHTGERPYQCPHCAKAFAISANLKAHARVHSGERPFVCEWCGRALSTAASLRGHMRVHTGERPYACASCPRTFALRSNLRQHSRVHSGERPYTCETCGKRFASSSDARAHGRTHSGERPHTCAACPRRFALASNLRAHTRTHAAAARAPLACAHCAAEFTCRSALVAHARAHRPRRPAEGSRQHACESCGKRFARKSNLVMHRKRQKACSGETGRTAANQNASSREHVTEPANQTQALIGLPNENVVVSSPSVNSESKLPVPVARPPRAGVALVQIGGGGALQVPLTFTLVPVSVLR